MADYLETYAAEFDLPVRTGVRVERLARNGRGFVLAAGDRRFEADNVVVAIGRLPRPSECPAFASELDPAIVQLALDRLPQPVAAAGGRRPRRRRRQLRRRDRPRSRRPSHPPGCPGGRRPASRSASRPARSPAGPAGLVRLPSHVLTVNTPIGRKIRPRAIRPRQRRSYGSSAKDLARAGVERVPRTVGVRDGRRCSRTAGCSRWRTSSGAPGSAPDFSWIDLPDLRRRRGAGARPRGRGESEPGLYFVGRFFLTRLTSALLGGVGRDAEHVARQIASRVQASVSS